MTKPIIEDTRWGVTSLGVESAHLGTGPVSGLKDDGYLPDAIPDSRDWNFWHRKAFAWFQYLNAAALVGNHTIDGSLLVGGQAYVLASTPFTADASTDKLTITASNLPTALGPVRVTNSGGALPAPLTAVADYWTVADAANTFRLATSFANAVAGTFVDITTAGTGTHSIASTGSTTLATDESVSRNLAVAGNLTAGTAAVGGAATVSGTLTCGSFGPPFVIGSIFNPPLLTGTINNWVVSGGFATAGLIEIEMMGAVVISGLLAGVPGRYVDLFVYSNTADADTVTLKHQDAGSTPANRFLLPNVANLVIPQYGCVRLLYSATKSRWVCAAKNF